MRNTVSCVFNRFISAEAAELSSGKWDGEKAVVLSFGDESSDVLDLAITADDARQMVAELLTSLASHGDELAAEIGERYFSA